MGRTWQPSLAVPSVPGLHAAIIEKLDARAAEIDPRLNIMTAGEMAEYIGVDAKYDKELAILRGGDPCSSLVEDTLQALKRAMTDETVRVTSLRANAERLKAGEPVPIAYTEILGITGKDDFPLDLAEMRRMHTRAAVDGLLEPHIVVLPDDTLRLAEPVEASRQPIRPLRVGASAPTVSADQANAGRIGTTGTIGKCDAPHRI